MGTLKPKRTALQDLLAVEIVAERISLVPVSRDYAPDIAREFTAEITRYMVPKSADDREQVHTFIDSSRENMAAGSELVLSILDAATGEFLGICGLHDRENGDTPELGIWLKKRAHGAGLGREAMRALVDWAQDKLDFSYLIYPVDKNNRPSRKLIESIGGIAFGECLKQSMSGHTLDEVLYRIEAIDN